MSEKKQNNRVSEKKKQTTKKLIFCSPIFVFFFFGPAAKSQTLTVASNEAEANTSGLLGFSVFGPVGLHLFFRYYFCDVILIIVKQNESNNKVVIKNESTNARMNVLNIRIYECE